MMGKLPLLIGLGLGYVLGSRAGRGHYDKLSDGVTKMWNDPRVQDKVETAKAKAPGVASKLTDQAKSATSNVKDKVADKVGNNTGERDLPKGSDLKSPTGGYGDVQTEHVTTPPVHETTTDTGVTADSWARPEETWRKDNNTGL